MIAWLFFISQLMISFGNGQAEIFNIISIPSIQYYNNPSAVKINSHGHLIVADTGNNAVKIISPTPASSTTEYSGFNQPFDISIDNEDPDFIVVVDKSKSGIHYIDMKTSRVHDILLGYANVIGQLDAIAAIEKNIVFAVSNTNDNPKIYQISLDGSFLLINVPTAVGRLTCIYKHGQYLYLCDSGYNAIHRLDIESSLMTSLDKYGLFRQISIEDAMTINNPTSVAIDSRDYLFIVERGENSILKLSLSTGDLTRLFSINDTTIFLDGRLVESFELGKPHGITIDTAGNLYVTETAGNRILKITICSSISCVSGKQNYYALAAQQQANKENSNDSSTDSSNVLYVILIIVGSIVIAAFLAGIGYYFVSYLRRMRELRQRAISPPISTSSGDIKSILSNNGTSAAASMKTVNISSFTETKQSTQMETTNITSNFTKTTLEGKTGIYIPGFMLFQENIDYTTDKKISEGGCGIVYIGKARHPKLIQYGDRIIIKNFKIDQSAMTDSIDTFMQEVSIMYLLRDSKYTAKLLGYSETPYCILMKFYSTGTLWTWLLSQRTRKTKRYQVRFIKNIAYGINAMFDKGLAHCDLKTANVLIDSGNGDEEDLFCVLTDFGISCLINSKSLTVDGFRNVQIKGASIAYASPESLARLKSKSMSYQYSYNPAKSDIYSFAIIVFAVLTRIRSFWNTKNISGSVASLNHKN